MLLNKGRCGDKQILSPEAVSYFTAGKLLPWQKEYMWSTWDSLAGYNYGNLMRVMEEPGMAYFQTWKGEYGWDGWLGTYFCNSPQNNVTILMGMQLKDAGAFPITQKMRNVLAHEEVLK
jgi:CubicO group peptidase (beta-lactamase class C family)